MKYKLFLGYLAFNHRIKNSQSVPKIKPVPQPITTSDQPMQNIGGITRNMALNISINIKPPKTRKLMLLFINIGKAIYVSVNAKKSA